MVRILFKTKASSHFISNYNLSRDMRMALSWQVRNPFVHVDLRKEYQKWHQHLCTLLINLRDSSNLSNHEKGLIWLRFNEECKIWMQKNHIYHPNFD